MKLTQKQVIEEIKMGKSLKDFPEWCDNKEVVLEAAKEDGWALRFASERLRDDKEVVLIAVKNDGWALEYVSKKLKDDKGVVLEAVKQYGWSLGYVSERLRDDKGVVLEAVKNYGWALRYASDKLKKELLPQVLKSFDYIGSLDPLELVRCNGDFLALLTTEEQNSKEVVLEAIKQNKSSLVYASQEIKDKIRNSGPVRYLEQWIKSEEKQKFLEQQLDKKEKNSKIKL